MRRIQASSSPSSDLAWLVAVGADEFIGEEPVDRTRLPPPAPQATETPRVVEALIDEPAYAPHIPPVAPPPSQMAVPTPAAHVSQVAPPPLPPAKAQNLDELKAALAAFDGSSLKKTATNLVFSSGNPQASVMLIGEAPGSEEDRRGEAFVGPSGQLLNKMLAAISLTRQDVYITNILPWRPPGNRKPTVEEMAMFLPFIARHIELVAPRFIVLLGGTATSALLGKAEGINRLQGRWFPYHAESLGRDIPALATFHPAFLLRSPAQKRNAWRSMLALRQRLDEGA